MMTFGDKAMKGCNYIKTGGKDGEAISPQHKRGTEQQFREPCKKKTIGKPGAVSMETKLAHTLITYFYSLVVVCLLCQTLSTNTVSELKPTIRGRDLILLCKGEQTRAMPN